MIRAGVLGRDLALASRAEQQRDTRSAAPSAFLTSGSARAVRANDLAVAHTHEPPPPPFGLDARSPRLSTHAKDRAPVAPTSPRQRRLADVWRQRYPPMPAAANSPQPALSLSQVTCTAPLGPLAPQTNAVCLRPSPRPRHGRFRRLTGFGRRPGPQGQLAKPYSYKAANTSEFPSVKPTRRPRPLTSPRPGEASLSVMSCFRSAFRSFPQRTEGNPGCFSSHRVV